MYKFKTGDKGNTVNGGTYVVLDVNEARKGWVLVAEITSPSGEHYVSSDFDVHGRHPYFPDLIPPKRYVWLNWHEVQNSHVWCVSYHSEEEARRAAENRPIVSELIKIAVKTEVPL